LSQHIYHDGTYEVVLGYDRPLDYVFCTVWNRQHEVVYSNLSDPNAGTEQQDVEYFRPVLAQLGITLWEEMWAAVKQDQKEKAGNKVVHYPRVKEESRG
jgi:hypothetical protein